MYLWILLCAFDLTPEEHLYGGNEAKCWSFFVPIQIHPEFFIFFITIFFFYRYKLFARMLARCNNRIPTLNRGNFRLFAE